VDNLRNFLIRDDFNSSNSLRVESGSHHPVNIVRGGGIGVEIWKRTYKQRRNGVWKDPLAI
jgi:hypothetical protein